jgi:hypothetical protein
MWPRAIAARCGADFEGSTEEEILGEMHRYGERLRRDLPASSAPT